VQGDVSLKLLNLPTISACVEVDGVRMPVLGDLWGELAHGLSLSTDGKGISGSSSPQEVAARVHVCPSVDVDDAEEGVKGGVSDDAILDTHGDKLAAVQASEAGDGVD
jgi:hypothetical protein